MMADHYSRFVQMDAPSTICQLRIPYISYDALKVQRDPKFLGRELVFGQFLLSEVSTRISFHVAYWLIMLTVRNDVWS